MTRSLKAAGLVLLGLAVSGLVWRLAYGMSGAGDGWNSSFISAYCVLALPLTGVAFVFGHSRAAWIIAGYLSLAAITLDIALVLTTSQEGWGYVASVWTHVPHALAIWAAIWGAWHAFIALLWWRLFREHGAAPNGGPATPSGDSGVPGRLSSVS